MFGFDKEVILDSLKATSFSFYSDEEIIKLSVKKVMNPVAFDHLGNPSGGGLYDKAMGISPFDHASKYSNPLLLSLVVLLVGSTPISAQDMSATLS